MLSYVVRMDTPSDPALRQRAGMVIDGPMVQKALAVADAGQPPPGKP
jgi:hypothetical protein